MNESTAKRRWNQIFFNYRRDYLKKYRLERRVKKIEKKLKLCEDDKERYYLRKNLKKARSELKDYDLFLLEKYKLKKLPDPVRSEDNEFHSGLFLPIIEVMSQNIEFLEIKIDRSYPHSVIKKELGEILKSLDLSEGKKSKKSGRPKLLDPRLVGERAQFWRNFYKTWLRNAHRMSDEYSRYIQRQTFSSLIIDRLIEDFPGIKRSTLNEYAKPYLMK